MAIRLRTREVVEEKEGVAAAMVAVAVDVELKAVDVVVEGGKGEETYMR